VAVVNDPILDVEGLCVTLDGAEILREVTFTLARGGRLAIVGPNGAGKTTLLRCLDGLVRPTRGEVRLAGRPVQSTPRRELARVVSYVPQGDTRSVHYTVAAFVEMGRYPHLTGWSGLGPDDVAAVRAALAMTETAHLVDRPLESLSGGERQRVFLAAALAQGGEVLLLDEPTSFLDYRHQVGVLAVLERLHRERGLTIVLVTHDLNGAAAAADRVLAMRDGRVVLDGPPRELFTADALAGIYGATFRLVPAAGRALPVVVPEGGPG